MKKIILTLFLFSSYFAYGQSLSLFDIDDTNFPIVKANFYAFDENGNQISNFYVDDFAISENGEKRYASNVSCPTPISPKVLSTVLVTDVSGSMSWGAEGTKNIDLAKAAVNTWIDALPFGASECAITSFDSQNYLNQDFTNDKSKLKDAIEQLIPRGGTDYNAALIEKPAGGLVVSKNGTNQKIIILLTDGEPKEAPDTEKIIKEAIAQNCIIFCVTLVIDAPKSLRDIASQTGGYVYDKITTIREIQQIYKEILQIAQGIEPCTIEWESEFTCDLPLREVSLNCYKNNTSTIANYLPSSNFLPRLEFSPVGFRFENPPLGTEVREKIIVTAKNSPFYVSNISSSNPQFTLTPNSFFLDKDESKELTLSYTSLDNHLVFTNFSIETDICEQYFSASAGWKGVKPKESTLKLTYPNGGEEFPIGNDAIITWEGVLPNDTVRIEYSIDNGDTWKIITSNATGFAYQWTNIPAPKSDKCLIRVSQGEIHSDYNPNNPSPQIVWEKTYGGSKDEEATSIIEDKQGNYVVAGWTESSDGDINTGNKGDKDYWILKLNSDNGDIIWEKTYGGIGSDNANSIIEDRNGNYVVAGWVGSNGGDVTEFKGNGDFWILQLNSENGDIIWKKNYGGSGNDYAYSIIQDKQGNYVVVGCTNSKDGDIHSSNKNNFNFWVVKIDSRNGDILWERTAGGSFDERAYSIIEDSDWKYVITGYTNSSDGDIDTGNKGIGDYWVIVIDSFTGNIIRKKTYGGSENDVAFSAIEDKKGNYIIAGRSNSYDYDIKSGNKGYDDYWITKLQAKSSNIIWEKSIGGSFWEMPNSIIEDSYGTYIVAGSTSSDDGDITSQHNGAYDFWIVKLDTANGNIIWEKTLGGLKDDRANSIIEDRYNYYVIAGATRSEDGDVKSGNKGLQDIWVVKLGEINTLQSDVSDNTFSIVHPYPSSNDIDMGKVLVNRTKDSLIEKFITNETKYQLKINEIYFQGADANSFSLMSGLPEYIIEGNNNHFGEISFKPIREGIHTAEIVIITPTDTIYHNIRGEGIEQKLQILNNIINFGDVFVRKFKDTIQVAIIKNIGSKAIEFNEIKHNFPNIIDFTTLSLVKNTTLQPNDELLLDMRFAPSEGGRTSGTLEFHYIGTGSPEIIQLFGTGIYQDPPYLSLRINDISAFAGDEVNIPIYIDSLENISNLEDNFISFSLEFNPTLLVPIEYETHILSDSLAYIQIDNYPINPLVGSILSNIKFIAGLGNSESCNLSISNTHLDSDTLIISQREAKFNILGICDEGGTRLINPWGNDYLMIISPNPSDGNVEISINLLEKGSKSLKIYDYNGALVEEFDLSSDLGNVNLSLNTQKYASGLYFVHLQTPTIIKRKKLIINR